MAPAPAAAAALVAAGRVRTNRQMRGQVVQKLSSERLPMTAASVPLANGGHRPAPLVGASWAWPPSASPGVALWAAAPEDEREEKWPWPPRAWTRL